MNSTYEFTLKEGPKLKMENFWRTKSWRKILEGLKRKVGIFIGTKNIFNPNIFISMFSKNIMNVITSRNSVVINFLKQNKMGPSKYLFLA